MYVWLKIVQLTLAAAVPLIALLPSNSTGTGIHWANLTVAAFGALVGLIEAVLQLGQYQQNWVLYRGTRETLKSEKRLYVGGIGPYTNEADPEAIYIQRCDAVISGNSGRLSNSCAVRSATGNAPGVYSSPANALVRWIGTG